MTERTIAHDRTVPALLASQARHLGDRPFLYFEDTTFSYVELDAAARRVARGLQELGTSKGDHVAVMLSNCPEFLFLTFGLSKIGAVEVPINVAHRGYLLSYMVQQAECSVMMIEGRLLPALMEVIGELVTLRHVVVVDGAADALPTGKGFRTYADLVANDGDHAPVDVRWNDPFVVMFTSGTTGPSKGAVLPHNYALDMAETVCEVAGYGPEDCLYNALPLFHGNAKLLSTMPALASGARMVLAERFSAARFWGDVRRYGCTEFNYIGGILSILLKADPRPDDQDHPLRLLFGAGAPPAVFEAFERRFGVTLLEGYGMSEIGLPLLSTPGARKPGSCGRPHRHYEVKLVDDDGVEVGNDTPGELLVRPRTPFSMLLGYYNMPEKTVTAWQDLWFHTGDYLMRDREGFYSFVDRKKDAIRRRGENISSFEVEHIVNTHPAVLECAAIPVRSELGEDDVMICVVREPGEPLTAAELILYCEGHMALFMVPRYVRFLDKLPKTPTERVQKYRLREEGVTADTWDREAASSDDRAPSRAGAP
jgi:crotonobetaine/carnitine-CoA ligase